MIRLTHNSRPFDPQRFARELEAKANELALDALEQKARGAASSIVDPETGRHAVVFVDRVGNNRLTIRTAGSAAFARLLEKRLGVDSGSVSIVGESSMGAEPRVYLAHASEDKEIVRPIAHFLQSKGLGTWFDEWEIGLGDTLQEKIDQGLDEMTHLVVILTPTSLTRPWVFHEINEGLAGLAGGKNRIVPLRIGVEVSDLPPFLQKLYSENFNPSSDVDKSALVDRLYDVSRRPALGDRPKHVTTVPDGLEGWSNAAVAVAQHLARSSEHAVSFDPYLQPEEIAEATGLSLIDVRLGILDLKDAGMVSQSEHGDRSIAPLGPLFVEFDASVMPFDPSSDALVLASRLLSEGSEDANTHEVAAKLGWEPRQMNSAIAFLERAGAIETIGDFACDPWRAVFLSPTDATLRFVRSKT